MAEIITSPKAKYVLSPDTIKAIEKIISSGFDVKIITGKNGLTVYKQKANKEYTQS